MKLFFSLLFSLLACQMAWSQTKYSTKSRNAIKSYETASYLLDLNNFDEAKTELLNAVKQDDEFIEAYLLLADVYRVTLENGTSTIGYSENGNLVIEIPTSDGNYKKEVFTAK